MTVGESFYLIRKESISRNENLARESMWQPRRHIFGINRISKSISFLSITSPCNTVQQACSRARKINTKSPSHLLSSPASKVQQIVVTFLKKYLKLGFYIFLKLKNSKSVSSQFYFSSPPTTWRLL